MRKIFMFRQKAVHVRVADPLAPAIDAALERLRLAGILIDIAGKTLAPHMSAASIEALLDLSIELETFELLLASQLDELDGLGASGEDI